MWAWDALTKVAPLPRGSTSAGSRSHDTVHFFLTLLLRSPCSSLSGTPDDLSERVFMLFFGCRPRVPEPNSLPSPGVGIDSPSSCRHQHRNPECVAHTSTGVPEDTTPREDGEHETANPCLKGRKALDKTSAPWGVSPPAQSVSNRALERRRLWFKRGSVQAITRISSVPQEYAYLVELAALLPQRVIENLVAQRRLGKQAKPCFATKQMEAALLFIDISGFTASMEMFAQQGSQGIEKFWKMFNAYFCDLLDVIQGTGGDIDCFAGDAILIVYETERLWEHTGEDIRRRIKTPDGLAPSKLALATMAASQCGGRLLNKLSPYHFSDGGTESTLTLHGSIGAGTIRAVNVGGATAEGESAFETFVCGTVFQQLAVAHDLSGKSEFCMSAEAVALAGYWFDLWDHPENEGCKIMRGVTVEEDGRFAAEGCTSTSATLDPEAGADPGALSRGLKPAQATMPNFYRRESEHTDLFARLELSPSEYTALDEDLRRFICRSIRDKMQSTRGGENEEGGSTLGELRRGTVGFVKFEIRDINSSQCHEQDEGIFDVAQVTLMAIREVLIAGGFVNKVIMDEKGLVLLFAFGTPGCSYEYNNLHAIRVALMIVNTSRSRFKRQTGIGIATGNMCTGLIGKMNFRSEYALAGDVVNLAARLAASAEKGKNGVLCDQTTLQSLVGEGSIYADAMADIKVLSVGSMRPKGKSYDIEVFQLSTFARRTVIRKSRIKEREISIKTSIKFVSVWSRADPLQQMRRLVARCVGGNVRCIYLESDAGLGKSTLVAELLKQPFPEENSAASECGQDQAKDARVFIAKIQAAHLEQSTPYYLLSKLVRVLMTLIVKPDRSGRIDMETFCDMMPPEAQRYVELLRYLKVPMRKHSTSRASSGLRRRTRHPSSTSISMSQGSCGFSRQSTLTAANTNEECHSQGTSQRYRFQRFRGEGEDATEFESAMELTLEAAEVLCVQMKSEIEVEDRDYRSTIFKNAFVGSQAVDWMCETDLAGSRSEAVAIGQRLVEFGLVDHVNSVYRFKDDLLFLEFRDRTTPWPKALEMDLDSAKTIALRVNMEIPTVVTQDANGGIHKTCFTGEAIVDWMINERVATCFNEAQAMADKLMALCVIESIDPSQERFDPTLGSCYVLRALALASIPPAQIFPLLQQLCNSILQVACASAAGDGKLVLVLLEDLHWADVGTLDMFQTFLQAGRDEPWHGGCAFLLTSRPASSFPAHMVDARDKIVADSDVTTLIRLGDLSEREAEQLTCRFLEVDELDFALRKLVVTSCSGSPLFIAEMCQSLCSTQGVQVVSTSSQKSRAALKTTGKDGEASSAPTSVQEIVAARIDALESTVALVLKVAAVIGETFSFDILEAVFPLDLGEDTLKKHLSALMACNFLTATLDTASGMSTYKFTHSLMSLAAYGMLLHSYRWRLHYRVAMTMSQQAQHSDMVLARHWLQVAKGNPTTDEIKDLGGPEAHRKILHDTIVTVSTAIDELMKMGQFIDASLFFTEGLEVIERMAETTEKTSLEIDLLLQGCRLTQFIEGYTTTLLTYARKAYDLAGKDSVTITLETRVRAELFIHQYEVMYGDGPSAIKKLQNLYRSIPKSEISVRMEPAAILVAALTQRGQFQEARMCMDILDEWKAAGSPAPLCMVMYEPVVTLMSVGAILAATGADDSRHLRWLNGLERYLKESTASKQPFNLYASMSLFGMLYPVCFEYAEMVRFYHSVYWVVYHPQVLLPIRRGLMFQAATATSRVQAKNAVITQGIEIMSLMCKVYESVNTPNGVAGAKKPKYFFKELMSIVRGQPTAAACAAVYQAARMLHLWGKAREILKLWDTLAGQVADSGRVSPTIPFKDTESGRQRCFKISTIPSSPTSIVPGMAGLGDEAAGVWAGEGMAARGESAAAAAAVAATVGGPDGASSSAGVDAASAAIPSCVAPNNHLEPDVDIYHPLRLFCKADIEIEELKDKLALSNQPPPEDGEDFLAHQQTLRDVAELFRQSAVNAAAVGNGLMEVRAASCYSRVLWEYLDDVPNARLRLRQIFDKFDTLCSLPNFFTPLRLTGLTAAMRLNSEMGGCYDDSEDEGDGSDGYDFGVKSSDEVSTSDDSSDDEDDSDDEGEDEDSDSISAGGQDEKEGENDETKTERFAEEGDAGVQTTAVDACEGDASGESDVHFGELTSERLPALLPPDTHENGDRDVAPTPAAGNAGELVASEGSEQVPDEPSGRDHPQSDPREGGHKDMPSREVTPKLTLRSQDVPSSADKVSSSQRKHLRISWAENVDSPDATPAVESVIASSGSCETSAGATIPVEVAKPARSDGEAVPVGPKATHAAGEVDTTPENTFAPDDVEGESDIEKGAASSHQMQVSNEEDRGNGSLGSQVGDKSKMSGEVSEPTQSQSAKFDAAAGSADNRWTMSDGAEGQPGGPGLEGNWNDAKVVGFGSRSSYAPTHVLAGERKDKRTLMQSSGAAADGQANCEASSAIHVAQSLDSQGPSGNDTEILFGSVREPEKCSEDKATLPSVTLEMASKVALTNHELLSASATARAGVSVGEALGPSPAGVVVETFTPAGQSGDVEASLTNQLSTPEAIASNPGGRLSGEGSDTRPVQGCQTSAEAVMTSTLGECTTDAPAENGADTLTLPCDINEPEKTQPANSAEQKVTGDGVALTEPILEAKPPMQAEPNGETVNIGKGSQDGENSAVETSRRSHQQGVVQTSARISRTLLTARKGQGPLNAQTRLHLKENAGRTPAGNTARMAARRNSTVDPASIRLGPPGTRRNTLAAGDGRDLLRQTNKSAGMAQVKRFSRMQDTPQASRQRLSDAAGSPTRPAGTADLIRRPSGVSERPPSSFRTPRLSGRAAAEPMPGTRRLSGSNARGGGAGARVARTGGRSAGIGGRGSSEAGGREASTSPGGVSASARGGHSEGRGARARWRGSGVGSLSVAGATGAAQDGTSSEIIDRMRGIVDRTPGRGDRKLSTGGRTPRVGVRRAGASGDAGPTRLRSAGPRDRA